MAIPSKTTKQKSASAPEQESAKVEEQSAAPAPEQESAKAEQQKTADAPKQESADVSMLKVFNPTNGYFVQPKTRIKISAKDTVELRHDNWLKVQLEAGTLKKA